MTTRKCTPSEFDTVLAVINDSAEAYRGVIPADCWNDPYMPADELRREIDDGVMFWCAEEDSSVLGVMGLQDKGDVALIRHAYVRTSARRRGVGTKLLRHLESMTNQPILIGTWAAASWAISFYEKSGYTLITGPRKDDLLRTYWSISDRQVETSVVLADPRWMKAAV